METTRIQKVGLSLATIGAATYALFSTSPSNAATAYIHDQSSCSGLTSSACITAQRLITGSTGDSFWGKFTIPDTIASGQKVTGGAYTGQASITFYGKPTSSGFSTSSSTGTYTNWAYNDQTNSIFFYGSQDSLQLNLAGPLVQGGGWMQISSANWCTNNSSNNGYNASTTCSGAVGFGTFGATSYIRVPSPSIVLGLTPFAILFTARQRRHRRNANTIRPSASTNQAC